MAVPWYALNKTPVEDTTKPVPEPDALSKLLYGELEDAYSLEPTAKKKRARDKSLPLDILRAELLDVYKAREETKKELPSIFQSYLNRIAGGTVDPEEASYSYLDIARSERGNLKEAYEQADILGSQTPGVVAAERYERYKPAASLAFEQLLGRTLGDQEYKNYVSAAQGLGISKGPDFQNFMGEALLSSPEYKSQAVIFDPSKVAAGLQAGKAARNAPSLKDYAAMLG